MKTKDRRRFTTVIAAAASPALTATAQLRDVGSMISSTTSSVKSYVEPIVVLVSVIVAIIAIFYVIPAIGKFSKGDPTSSDTFLKLGGGVIIAFALLYVIKAFVL